MRRLPAILVALAAMLLPGAAAAAGGEGGPAVAAVDVVGAARYGADGVRRLMKTAAGTPFSLPKVREDVKAIWATGYFDDVKVDATDTANGLRITVFVAEKPVVSSVTVDGNKEISVSDLRSAAALPERTLYQEGRVKEGAARILEAYRNKGYYDAVVDPSVEEDADGSRRVRYRVTEGEKPRIHRLVFAGNRYFGEKEIRKGIETDEKGFFSFVTDSGTFKKDVLENDLRRVEGQYQGEGFLDVKVAPPEIARDSKGLVVTVRVYEGIQYRVGKVDVSGMELTAEERGKAVKLSPGGKASRETIVTDLLSLTTLLNDRGFAQALVTPDVKKRPDYPLVDVTYRAEPGGPFRFGRVEIAGNTKTLDKVVRRELAFSDGGRFGSTVQKESRENLQRTSYFKDVKLTTSPGAPGEMDARVEVQEGSTGTLSGGLGFSSVDKIFGVVNVSENNLFGRGWKGSLNSQFSSRKTVFGLDFRDPHVFDTDYTLLVSAYNSDTRYSDFRKRSVGGKLGAGYNLSRVTTASLALRLDWSRVEKQGTTASSFLEEQYNQGLQSTRSVVGSVSRSTLDRVMDPSRGTSSSASLEWAGFPLGGDSHFAKYILSWKGYTPVTGSTVFSANFLWGHSIPTDGGAVPLHERFFLGGPYSVRGFRARTLAPEDPNTGERYGGNKEFVVNAEFLVPIVPEVNVKGVLFLDAGNTWGQGDYPFVDQGLRTAAGFGIRWYSPMGPLRFEWGWNLDPKPGEEKRVAEFTIGTAF